ncbi:MAG: superoxide dismutase [Candidatus Diapherotrites archaeon]|nr:superoxide dismutase [Candidatus Diapherotrites archaeon]
MSKKFYNLPELDFEYSDLEPLMSEEQLKIHHLKHHQAYVTGANTGFENIDNSRKNGTYLDAKATLKNQSFNIGGHILHALFWKNLKAPTEENKPTGKILEFIKNEFGSFERFKEEFSQTALSIEGSGWATVTYCNKTNRILLMQIEKHNTNIYPSFSIILVLDMFEHAYYIDYKNQKNKYIEAFWKMINWKNVNERLEKTIKT